MGFATLGFPDGMGIRFRIDPQSIDWNFKVNTSVTNTVGGRVVQVNGATLSDITIQGLFGEDRSRADGTAEHEGRSWRLAKRFTLRIRQMMEWQARDAQQHAKMHRPAVFAYPPENWRFRVYIKDIADPDGGVISLSTGKFSHGYVLTLQVVQEASDALVRAGSSNGMLDKARAKAINGYISRISQGVGWKPSEYNGNFGDYYGSVKDSVDGSSPKGAAALRGAEAGV
jgi:hypothetical protein